MSNCLRNRSREEKCKCSAFGLGGRMGNRTGTERQVCFKLSLDTGPNPRSFYAFIDIVLCFKIKLLPSISTINIDDLFPFMSLLHVWKERTHITKMYRCPQRPAPLLLLRWALPAGRGGQAWDALSPGPDLRLRGVNGTAGEKQ